MNPEIDNSSPALLSTTELRWLRNDIKVSKSFEYKIKSNIKRKVHTLTELELPLLVKNNFFDNDGYHYEIDDDGLGRDLESGPPPSYSSNDTTLVSVRLLHIYYYHHHHYYYYYYYHGLTEHGSIDVIVVLILSLYRGIKF